jgi:hypothetical protein
LGLGVKDHVDDKFMLSGYRKYSILQGEYDFQTKDYEKS